MNFQECLFNHLPGNTKFRQTEVVISWGNINHLFNFNNILRSEKAKRYFIELKANILIYKCWLFFEL